MNFPTLPISPPSMSNIASLQPTLSPPLSDLSDIVTDPTSELDAHLLASLWSSSGPPDGSSIGIDPEFSTLPLQDPPRDELSLNSLGVTTADVLEHSDGLDLFTEDLEGISYDLPDYYRPPLARCEADDPQFDPIHLGIVTEIEVAELLPRSSEAYELQSRPCHLHAGVPAAKLALSPYRGVWLFLFLWGSFFASTMPWVMRAEDFGPRVHQWHEEPYSLPEDQQIVALVTLRTLGCVKLFPLVSKGDPTVPYATLKSHIDVDLEDWRQRWIGDPNSPDYMSRSPLYRPYLMLLFDHFKIQLYTLALKQHPSSVRQISTDCFRAALGVVQHAVTELAAEASLRFMINNTADICLVRHSP
ncbi:hypothetical protein RQP46_010610 [Phenoliferia psychrophenolica]